MSHYCEMSKPFCPRRRRRRWRRGGFPRTVRSSCPAGGLGDVERCREYMYERVNKHKRRRRQRWRRPCNVFGHRLVQLSDPRLRRVRGHYIIVMYGLWVLRPLCSRTFHTERIIHGLRHPSRVPALVIYSFKTNVLAGGEGPSEFSLSNDIATADRAR